MGQTSFGRMESFFFLPSLAKLFICVKIYWSTWTKPGGVMYMCARDIEFTYFYDFSIECWNCSNSVIYIFSFYYRLWKKTAELQLLKKISLWSSSVIKIVKMKYNRIDIKWWLVSTSFKIYLEIRFARLSCCRKKKFWTKQKFIILFSRKK
jgi:hypothetical protein